MSAITVDVNPARLYLDSLAKSSHWGMRQALESAAQFLSGGKQDAESFPWAEVRYRHTATVRSHWAARYQPATVNKLLAGLRGVLKQTWRLGMVDAETYHRAIDIDNVRGSVLPRGRALEPDELSELFRICAEDTSAAGRRDAAMLAILYTTGMRRAELAGLDLDDFDHDEMSIRVLNAKRRQQRIVYLTEEACQLIDAWLTKRGKQLGPLISPIRQNGNIEVRRLRGESIAYILRRRQKQAEIAPFSPHDLRRTCLSHLLDAGVDVFTVQRLAGHAETTTTARYDRRGESAKKQAVQQLHLPTIA